MSGAHRGRDAALIGLTALHLWVPLGRHPSPLLAAAHGLALAALVVALFLPLRALDGDRATRLVLGSCRLYAIWILMAAALHALALSRLTPAAAELVAGDLPMRVLATYAQYHLLLPAAVGFGLRIFAVGGVSRRALRWLPVVALPSIAVAVLQALGAGAVWNVPYFEARGQAAGLGHDANSLAASLALLVPFALLPPAAAAVTGRRDGNVRTAARVGALVVGVAVAGSRAGLLATALALIGVATLQRPPGATALATGTGWRRARVAAAVVAVLAAVAVAAAVGAGRGPATVSRLRQSIDRVGSGGAVDLLRDSGRLHYARQAMRMIAAAPVSGWGPGGFTRQLDEVRFRHRDVSIQFGIDNATNSLLQVGAELGVPAAALFVFIYFVPLVRFARRRPPLATGGEREDAMSVAIGLSAFALILPLNHYVLFPDVIWLLGLSIGMVAAAPGGGERRTLGRWAWTAAVGLTLLVFAATVAVTFGDRGYRVRSESADRFDAWSRRCHALEPWEGGAGRWCLDGGRLLADRSWARRGAVALRIRVGHPDAAERPVRVLLRAKDTAGVGLTIDHDDWIDVDLPASADSLVPCQDDDGRLRRCVGLEIRVSRSFVPSEWGPSPDRRELALAVVIDDGGRDRAPSPPRPFVSNDFESGDLSDWSDARGD